MAPIQRTKVLLPYDFAKEIKKQKSTHYPDTTSRNSASTSIRAIAWNPLGSLIACGAADRTLRIWNPEKPALKNSTELRGHMGIVEHVAFNPRSETELASCGADGILRFWDVRSKASISEVKLGGDASKLVWKPDGTEVVVARKDDNLIPISRQTFTPLTTPQKHPTKITSLLFSWSSAELLLSTSAGQIQILDYPSFTPIHSFQAHTSPCPTLDLSPTGSFLAVGGEDAIISLWDTKEFICQRTFAAMDGPVRSVSFSFDGHYLVGGSEEGLGLDVAHVESGEYMYRVATNRAAPLVSWHPSRYVLAYVEEGRGLGVLGASWQS